MMTTVLFANLLKLALEMTQFDVKCTQIEKLMMLYGIIHKKLVNFTSKINVSICFTKIVFFVSWGGQPL